MGNEWSLVLKNAEIMGRPFWESLKKLMDLTDIPVMEKLNLVELRKELTDHVENVAEVLSDLDKEKAQELMRQEFGTMLDPVTAPLESLSAEDMFRLKGIIKLEK